MDLREGQTRGHLASVNNLLLLDTKHFDTSYSSKFLTVASNLP